MQHGDILIPSEHSSDISMNTWLSDLDLIPYMGGAATEDWFSASHTNNEETLHQARAPKLPGPQNDFTIGFLVGTIRTYPSMLLHQGKIPFIHPWLLSRPLQPAMQDAFTLCAVYSTLNQSNKSHVFGILEARTGEMIRREDTDTISMSNSLARVQALIFAHIIQLFDGDIRQRGLAEGREIILRRWTARLQEQSEEQSSGLASPAWNSWVFAESVRRTVITSYVLIGLYSLIKTGDCGVIDLVAPLPFSAHTPLWSIPYVNAQRALEHPYTPLLATYDDFVRSWETTRKIDIQPFERYLLVACMGEDCEEIIPQDSLVANMS